jgi:RNA polymerase sigma-70 factor, ECF subfamily
METLEGQSTPPNLVGSAARRDGALCADVRQRGACWRLDCFRAEPELPSAQGACATTDRLRRGDVINSKPAPVQRSTPHLRLVREPEGRPRAGQPPGDAELVRALRAGDPEAPALLWARYSPAVARVLARALGPSLDVEDLTQEVFLRVFRRMFVLRDPSALRAFVLAVAMNVLKWELRRRWVSRKIRLSGTGTLPDIESASADAEARQALRRCYRIFESLPTNERMAFVLRYMEGMTIDEVASALAVSVSTAKRWVSRGAAKVSEQVTEDADLCSFFAGERKEHAHEP